MLTVILLVARGPAYASEVTPVNLRGYLTTYVNLCWAIGQFIAAGVLDGLVNRPDEWSYRIPFAVQWVWPVPILITAFFAPESPWWLVRQGRLEDAKKSVMKLTSRDCGIDFNVDEFVMMMKSELTSYHHNSTSLLTTT